MRRYNLSFGQIASALDLHKNSVQHHLKQLEKYADDLELPSFFFQNIDRSAQTYEEKIKAAQEIAAKYYEEKKYLIDRLKETLKGKRYVEEDINETEVIEDMEVNKTSVPVILRQAVRESKATVYENYTEPVIEKKEEKKEQPKENDNILDIVKPLAIAVFAGFVIALMQRSSTPVIENKVMPAPVVQEKIDPFAQFRRGYNMENINDVVVNDFQEIMEDTETDETINENDFIDNFQFDDMTIEMGIEFVGSQIANIRKINDPTFVERYKQSTMAYLKMLGFKDAVNTLSIKKMSPKMVLILGAIGIIGNGFIIPALPNLPEVGE
ncbi:helix-turn-helix transcriptional regulator [Marinitoga lauensis]|uniref:helix-turn-helix transcriptional regulator n=3 Tax=Marinitoga lauensis TaxID=2201189 RepID=UPI0010110269|nr:helix-turn-helix transcriptional regulator [Marinitoga lauensis]